MGAKRETAAGTPCGGAADFPGVQGSWNPQIIESAVAAASALGNSIRLLCLGASRETAGTICLVGISTAVVDMLSQSQPLTSQKAVGIQNLKL